MKGKKDLLGARHRKTSRLISRMLCVLALVGLITGEGCMLARKKPPVIVDGEAYGVSQGPFRGTWWQYYERAGSYIQGELWILAEDDLRQALKKNDRDGTRFRTYGMHFIDYFPHRELGMVLMSQGKYDEAIAELETSLGHEVSSKAEYYLDQSRALKIKKENLDQAPPEIRIDSPDDGETVNSLSLQVKGRVADDTFVKTVSINGRTMPIHLAKPVVDFDTELALREGENTITVEAEDLSGKQSRAEVMIFVDRAGPFLNIEELEQDVSKGHDLQIKVYAGDDTGLKQIVANGRACPITGAREVIWGKTLSFPCEEGQVSLVAEDVLGNATHARIPCPGGSGKLGLFHKDERLFASLDLSPGDLEKGGTFASDKTLPEMSPQERIRGGGVAGPDWKAALPATGSNYALIVGINAYREWQPLKTAVHDAREMKDVLVSRYGFKDRHVTLLLDGAATKAAFFDAVMALTSAVGEADNLLVYFAGHGQLSDLANDGYWIPVEGKRGDAIWSWIAHSAVKNLIVSEEVRAKNIVVIADSCYGGQLLRGGESLKRSETALEKIAQLSFKKSRQVISSGSLEPVVDWGRDNHSLFSFYLLKGLRENRCELITLKSIINAVVWEPVFNISGQRPVVGRLKTPMDEDGEFVLCLGKGGRAHHSSLSPTESAPVTGKINRSETTGDGTPPAIVISDWKERQTVTVDSVFIEGHVTDKNLIRDVTLNGRSVLKRQGKNIFFHQLEALKPGDNTFVVTGTDIHGNTSRKELHIVKKVNPIFCEASRMSAVVFPVEVTGEASSLKGIDLESLLFDYLFDSCRFNLKNVRFSDAGDLHNHFGKLSDDAKLAEKARKLGIDFIIKGKAVVSPEALDLRIRIVETETLDVVSVTDVYQDGMDRDGILLACKGLVAKVCRDLPVVVGKIARVKGRDVLVNVGSGTGIKKGMHIVFFSDPEKILDPDTGEALGLDVSEIGTARISRIQKKMSEADILKLQEKDELKVGLQVVTK